MFHLFSMMACLFVVLACSPVGPPSPFRGNPAEPCFKEREPEKFCWEMQSGGYGSPEDLIARSGLQEGAESQAGYYFAEGGGCLSRPLREVWAVTHHPNGLKWKDADFHEETPFKKLKNEAGTEFIFRTHHEAGPFFARQWWFMEWWHYLEEGTKEAPQRIIIHYQKTEGTSHIKLWEGCVELERLAPEVTVFSGYNRIRGTRINVEKAEGGLRDIFGNLEQREPNWSYLEDWSLSLDYLVE